MDAQNPSSLPTAASRAPLHIGSIGLAVRDLDRMTGYYRDLLRLSVLERTDTLARLGTPGGVPLLDLEHRPGLKPDDPREAGLYHTAFLMPTRADHARWILHMARSRIPITGASDHGVSEAFYLDDPEGNGVEIYNDRPSTQWQWEGDRIVMPTVALDIEAIVSEVDPATADYDSAPEGLRIGHVHLRAGDVAQAEAYFRDAIGLAVTRTRGGATFLSSGGYHHHIAANVWHSAGAGRRDPDRAGLSWLAIEAADETALETAKSKLQSAGAPIRSTAAGFETEDPWGTRIRFVRA